MSCGYNENRSSEFHQWESETAANSLSVSLSQELSLNLALSRHCF